MTQEEKDLLLKDLCGRLPYGVKVWYKYYSENVTERFATSIRLAAGKIALSSKFYREGDWYPVEEANELLIKPYLRPMSSMNEGEISDLQKINSQFCFDTFDNFAYVGAADDGFCSVEEMSNILNYLNSHHFDYRGLIEKGLAIEVTEENNPYT